MEKAGNQHQQLFLSKGQTIVSSLEEKGTKTKLNFLFCFIYFLFNYFSGINSIIKYSQYNKKDNNSESGISPNDNEVEILIPDENRSRYNKTTLSTIFDHNEVKGYIVVCQVLILFMIAGFAMVAAGLILERVKANIGNIILTQLQAIVVGFLAALVSLAMEWVSQGYFNLRHALVLCSSSVSTASITSLALGLGGNLVAAQASRLSTTLHQQGKPGEFQDKRYLSITRVLLFLAIPGHLTFVFIISRLATNDTGFSIVLIFLYLITALIQVAILLYIAQWMVIFVWRDERDPYNVCIPYLIVIGDLLDDTLLICVFLLLF
ncbi:unnamed protein product [Adineta steineri]|uniref:SLC41A/MgtE integral membrane domain-containing protein n=1 Tax=Adineta steineri TaxID=433720 RepID=A0A814B825_9BILA|nr:unnamed protein product [Adineta steineri]CAF3846589.1 unnamed protein product [Adineta steineri]